MTGSYMQTITFNSVAQPVSFPEGATVIVQAFDAAVNLAYDKADLDGGERIFQVLPAAEYGNPLVFAPGAFNNTSGQLWGVDFAGGGGRLNVWVIQ